MWEQYEGICLLRVRKMKCLDQDWKLESLDYKAADIATPLWRWFLHELSERCGAVCWHVMLAMLSYGWYHGTHLVTQCAAVRTHCVPMRAPPHRYWFSELMRATCQHHSAGSPSSPPTTRLCLSRPRAVPFTPHTYLLYTGGRVVVEPPSGAPGKSVLCSRISSVFYIYCRGSISLCDWRLGTATRVLLHIKHKRRCRALSSVPLSLRIPG
jgi:hypothetical protein